MKQWNAWNEAHKTQLQNKRHRFGTGFYNLDEPS